MDTAHCALLDSQLKLNLQAGSVTVTGCLLALSSQIPIGRAPTPTTTTKNRTTTTSHSHSHQQQQPQPATTTRSKSEPESQSKIQHGSGGWDGGLGS